MTRLTIYAEWTAFILQQIAMLFAFLQASGVFPLVSDPVALGVVSGVLALNTYLPTLAKNAQEFAARLEVLKGARG